MSRIKLVIILLVVIASTFVIYNRTISGALTVVPSTQFAAKENYLSYKGQTGKDALTLLKEKAKVGIDRSGLVISINNRIALASKREYWAFYVNGKLASVGPADYKTKNDDFIEWKIEKY